LTNKKLAVSLRCSKIYRGVKIGSRTQAAFFMSAHIIVEL
jgi:hypothetical protein